MKVLLVNDYLYEQGGIYTHLMTLKDELEKQGLEVAVLSSKSIKKDYVGKIYTFKSLNEHGIIFRILQLYNPFASWALRKAIKDYKPDIIHFHYIFNQASPSVIYTAAKRNIPSVLTVHGFEMVHFNYKVAKVGLYNYEVLNIETAKRELQLMPIYLYKRLKFLIYKRAFKRLAGFITPSKYAKNLLSKEQQQKTFVIYHGIATLKPTPLQNWDSILYIGRLIEGKGIDVLFNALPIVARARPNIRVTICGDGPHKVKLLELAESLKILDYIIFTGRINHDQIGKYMKQSTVFVIPSVRPETFSVSGMEALSAGRPVVATNIGAVKEWLISEPQCGLQIEPNNAQQLSEAILQLLSNKEELLRINKDGPVKAANFSVSKMGLSTVATYEKLISRIRIVS